MREGSIDHEKKDAFDILIPLLGLKETSRSFANSFIKGIVIFETRIPDVFVYWGKAEHNYATGQEYLTTEKRVFTFFTYQEKARGSFLFTPEIVIKSDSKTLIDLFNDNLERFRVAQRFVIRFDTNTVQSVINRYITDKGENPSVVKMSEESYEDLVKSASHFTPPGDKKLIFGIPVEFVDGMAFGDFVVT